MHFWACYKGSPGAGCFKTDVIKPNGSHAFRRLKLFPNFRRKAERSAEVPPHVISPVPKLDLGEIRAKCAGIESARSADPQSERSNSSKKKFIQFWNFMRPSSKIVTKTPRVETAEGYLDFDEHKLYYCIVKPPRGMKSVKTPVLVLHGGPQVPHDYLEPLQSLAEFGHPVIFYDQSGCGKSGLPSDPSVLSMDYLNEQLAFIMDELGLSEVHLFGQSAGGILALEFFRTHPESIVSLTLSNTPSSVKLFMKEATGLMGKLPEEVQEILGTELDTSSSRYKWAMDVFNRNFLCRLDPWPECLDRAFAMGGDTFRGVGAIADWSISEIELSRVDVPTLLLSGKYDEVTPRCISALYNGIKDTEWVVFEESSHMPFLEEPVKFTEEMVKFLNKVEPL